MPRRPDTRRSDSKAEAPLGRLTFISWADACSRSDHTARELSGRSFMVYAAALGSHPATIWLKYLVQWYRTTRLLYREKPDTILVMSPPLFAALPALLYARSRNVRVAIDAHTCAFLLPRWKRLQRWQLALCQRASTTFVTNEHLARTLEHRGARATIVPDVPVLFERITTYGRPPGFTIAVVCSFDADEPTEAIFAAAEELDDVQFVVTGDHSGLPNRVRQSLPINVVLTGYLPTDEYAGLLTAADAVMDLTTLDHTMLRGAYEAIYQGRPVIVSNWPLLRTEFPIGALHVDNSLASIVEAVRDMRARHSHFLREAAQLRDAKTARWQDVKRSIVSALSPNASGSTSMAEDR